jgi:hypothetical protein
MLHRDVHLWKQDSSIGRVVVGVHLECAACVVLKKCSMFCFIQQHKHSYHTENNTYSKGQRKCCQLCCTYVESCPLPCQCAVPYFVCTCCLSLRNLLLHRDVHLVWKQISSIRRVVHIECAACAQLNSTMTSLDVLMKEFATT